MYELNFKFKIDEWMENMISHVKKYIKNFS
jgi:hypothetical protein